MHHLESMGEIRKILVPVDFSASSREAERTACDLARRLGASITLMHVYQVPGYVLPEGFLVAGPETVTDIVSSLEQALAAAKERVEAEGIACDTRLEQGGSDAEIVRVSDEGAYDLIVIGTHGRTGLSHAILGSVAEKVVRRATVPVLTVHASKAAEEEARV